MTKHFRTHTGQRPFVCKRCGYAAARSDHLDSHIKAKACNIRKRHLRSLPVPPSTPNNDAELQQLLPDDALTCLQCSFTAVTADLIDHHAEECHTEQQQQQQQQVLEEEEEEEEEEVEEAAAVAKEEVEPVAASTAEPTPGQ